MDRRVLQRPGWWDSDFCGAIRAAMAAASATPAEIVAGGYAIDREARRAADVDVDPRAVATVERAIEVMLGPLGAHFDLPLTRYVGPSFLQYAPGGFYGRHTDRGDDPHAVEWQRRVSVVVFLNSAVEDAGGFVGGTLRLYLHAPRATVDITPQAGMLVAFPSETPHEVLPVRSGVREVVVDWLY